MPCYDITVTVTLDPGGCGLEYSGGSVISIGNQYVGATVSPSSDENCGTISAKLNGESPPIVACDGDGVSVSIETEHCSCVDTGSECTGGTPLHMVSKLMPNGRLQLQLEYNPKLTAIKKHKALQRLRKRIIEKKLKQELQRRKARY